MMRRLLAVFSVCALGLSADTLYSNLADGFNPQAGLTISGPGSLVGQLKTPAEPFTTTSPSSIDGIDLALGWVAGTNSAIVNLDTSNGSAPGDPIGSWTLNGLPVFGADYPLEHVSVQGVSLASGTYWITVGPGADDSWDAWNLADHTTMGAFDITGTSAPEAGTVASFLIWSLMALLITNRKRGMEN